MGLAPCATKATTLSFGICENLASRIVMAAMMPVALAACTENGTQSSDAHNGIESGSAHYLLLFPSSTIETDLGGDCVRLTNKADGVLYLPVISADLFKDSQNAYRTLLNVNDCAAK